MNKKHILAIIILGMLVYSNTLKNPYLWDDGLFIQNGNFIKKFENAKVFFSPQNYFGYTQDFTYRPLPFLIHIVNYKIWGVNPVGHRLVNIFLHIAVAVLLYFLVMEVVLRCHCERKRSNLIAFLSGLFFVVHPANTEVVNMVSFLETQLSTVFFLLAFFLYLKSKKSESVLCYFLAVFSKETAVTLPAIIILYDLTRNVIARSGSDEAISNKIVKKYLPFFAVAGFYLIVRFFAFRHPTETMVKYPGDSFITNIFVVLKAVPVYLSALFLPFNLSVEHNLKIPATFFQTPVIFGFFALIIFIAVSIYSYKKSKPVFFWMLFSAVTFLPTSNVIPMQNIVAERYLYLPLIGICAVLALFVEKLCSRPLRVGYGVAGCIVIFFSVLTVIRNLDWKDDFTFYSKTLKQNPDSAGANINMAMMYVKKKDFTKAMEYVGFAIKLDPNYIEVQSALASVYQDFGYFDKAIEIYEKMLAEKKYTIHKAPFLNLGIIYKIKKQYPKAIENFNKAIALYPLSSVSYSHLAEIYDEQSDIEKAEKYYEKSADINPDDYIPLNALGIIYGKNGNYDKSLKYLKKALNLKPDSADVHFNIGYVYFLSYEYGKALKEMEITLKLDPNYEKAKFVISQITGKK